VIGGLNGPMSEVFRRIGVAAAAAGRDRPVLIVGETGTGKDLVARALFHYSARRDCPFLKVKCAAFHEKELEAELFGHEGVDGQQVGVFEKAHGGAVLLDDIGETSRLVQANVLQAINDGVIVRGGRGTKVAVDVWVIACALHDFDSELYYRLTPPVRLPPLRERGEDLDQLARHFLEKAAAQEKRPVRTFHGQALEKLRRYHWPGNVRELQQAVSTAVLLCREAQVTVAELKLGPGSGMEAEVSTHLRRAIQAALSSGRTDLHSFLTELLERELAHLAWVAAGGSLEGAASLAGLSPTELQRTLRDRLGIDPRHHETGEKSLTPARGLPPSRLKAWQSYHLALERNPSLEGHTDADVFQWLQCDPRTDSDDLPDKCETFERYLREARAYYGDHKNTPRLARPTGRSIVRPDQI